MAEPEVPSRSFFVILNELFHLKYFWICKKVAKIAQVVSIYLILRFPVGDILQHCDVFATTEESISFESFFSFFFFLTSEPTVLIPVLSLFGLVYR